MLRKLIKLGWQSNGLRGGIILMTINVLLYGAVQNEKCMQIIKRVMCCFMDCWEKEKNPKKETDNTSCLN